MITPGFLEAYIYFFKSDGLVTPREHEGEHLFRALKYQFVNLYSSVC